MSRTILRCLLGAFWLIDGFLQLQPAQWTVNLVSSTTQAAAAMGGSQPGHLADLLIWSAQIEAKHVILLNATIATVELVMGILLITGRWVRATLAVSIIWAAGIWIVGEGLGGLFSGTALMFTGAPGAALLYALLSLLVFPRYGGTTKAEAGTPPGWLISRRAALFVNAGLWLVAAGLQLQPDVAKPQGLWHLMVGRGMMGGGILENQPPFISPAMVWFTSFVFQHGAAAVLLMSLVQFLVAVGLLTASRAWQLRVVIAVGLAWCLGVWWVGQALGGVFSGGATDVGSAPLYALLLLFLWPGFMRPQVPERLNMRLAIPLVLVVALASATLAESAVSATPQKLEELLSRSSSVAIMAAHRQDLLVILGVSPSQDGSGRAIVRLLDPEPVTTANVSLLVTSHGQPGSLVTLTDEGEGNYGGELARFRHPGRWRVTVLIARPADSVAPIHFLLRLPLRSADGLIVSSDGAMNRLRSATIDQVTSEERKVVRSHYFFQAPDLELARDVSGRLYFVRGSRQYVRIPRTGWHLISVSSSALRWPDQNFAAEALNPTISGEGRVGRALCDIVSFWVPQSDTTYRLWIGRANHLVYRETLEQPLRSETLIYSMFNQRQRIPTL